jgi:molybdenum cofactor cytidylyltransferase
MSQPRPEQAPPQDRSTVGAVILAAGRGHRMGRAKAVLPWGDRTLLEAWVERLQLADVDRIVVVLGVDAEAIRTALPDDLPVTWVVNPEPDTTGPRESLLLGLDALPPDTPAWFTPVDVPVVGDTVLGKLRKAYERAVQADAKGPGPLAALPSYRRHPGHPVLASPSFIAHLYEGERGDRIDELLSWATRRQVIVETSDVRVVGNMNRPQDYEAFVPPPGASWDWTEDNDDQPPLVDGLATLDLTATNPSIPVPVMPEETTGKPKR